MCIVYLDDRMERMDDHLFLTFQALIAPLLTLWESPEASPPFLGRAELATLGLVAGLIPWLHTTHISPMGLIVRHVRKVCRPLDEPAGVPQRSGLGAVLIACGIWGGIGAALSLFSGIVGAGLSIIVIGSLCNLSAVPLRALKAVRLLNAGHKQDAQDTLSPLNPGALSEDTFGLYRRASEAMIIWFACGVVGGLVMYLLFGLPGLMGYAALRGVARYVDRRGYSMEHATGPVLVEAIAGYAAGCLAAVILWLGMWATPGAHIIQSWQGIRRAFDLRTYDRPIKLRRLAISPALHVVCHALNIQLLGPNISRPTGARPDAWLGPDKATAQIRYEDTLRIGWLVLCSSLILMGLTLSTMLLPNTAEITFIGPLTGLL